MTPRQEAASRGETRYHSSPCKICNDTERSVSRSVCVNCAKRHWATYNATEKGKAKVTRKVEAAWVKRLKDEYGLSVDDFERMNEEQGGLCFICHSPPTSRCRRLSVDHNHKTGKVRKLLCTHCNRFLGLFKEDVERIKRAMEYIEMHREEENDA